MSNSVIKRRSTRLLESKPNDSETIQSNNDKTATKRENLAQDKSHTYTSNTTDEWSVDEPIDVECSDDEKMEDEEVTLNTLSWFVNTLHLVIGASLAILIGYHYSLYIWTLHENRLWFSDIMEVEREISFRTEAGLYYSYYKQMINSPSITQGLHDLINDTETESWRSINILKRFNIYQEIFLAVIYRLLSLQSVTEPIFFYINSVFALHGAYMIALYTVAWLLSGSWLAGVLATSLYIFNKEDTTRIEFTVPLRESFALPYLCAQMMFITYYLRPRISTKAQNISLVVIGICSFLFVVTWQFAQFVFLLQAMSLFGTAILGMAPLYKVRCLLATQASSLISVCILQFFNHMLLGALVLSFIPAAFIILHFQDRIQVKHSIPINIVKLLVNITLVLLLTVCFNAFVKYIINLDDDQHIFKFLLAKFHIASTRDFDALMYKCNGAFQFLLPSFFERTSNRLLFPIYLVTIVILLIILLISVVQKWRNPVHEKMENHVDDEESSSGHLLQERPELAYHTIQSVFFGAMALTVLRLKFVWTPQMCILAAVGVSDSQAWRYVMKKIGITSDMYIKVIQHLVTLLVITVLIFLCLPDVQSQLEVLREFYDPDTVQLMHWIMQNTPKTAVFSGSMQLLAGVKLCTGRKLTNHPHYEDRVLREKTKQLYQYYGKKSPEDVFNIHENIGTDYIILEDSICYATSSPQGCRLPDIIDITNGHLYDGAKANEEPGLVKVSTMRFCDAIQRNLKDYIEYFTPVFKNKTFRIYKVRKDKNRKRNTPVADVKR